LIEEDSEQVKRARAQWFYRGQQRPDFADPPNANQRSVWDFPRPPALEKCAHRCEVKLKDITIAASQECWMVCETAHPPTYYFPRDSVSFEWLREAEGSSFCEWKGQATYYSVAIGGIKIERSVWSYKNSFSTFKTLEGAIAFMPAPFDCFVDGESVRPQPGGFYGGWITSHFSGPFKGEAGISG